MPGSRHRNLYLFPLLRSGETARGVFFYYVLPFLKGPFRSLMELSYREIFAIIDRPVARLRPDGLYSFRRPRCDSGGCDSGEVLGAVREEFREGQLRQPAEIFFTAL